MYTSAPEIAEPFELSRTDPLICIDCAKHDIAETSMMTTHVAVFMIPPNLLYLNLSGKKIMFGKADH
jgi:hypothetical protein